MRLDRHNDHCANGVEPHFSRLSRRALASEVRKFLNTGSLRKENQTKWTGPSIQGKEYSVCVFFYYCLLFIVDVIFHVIKKSRYTQIGCMTLIPLIYSYSTYMHIYWRRFPRHVPCPKQSKNINHITIISSKKTDRRRTKWSLCAAMLRRRHKNR